MNNDFDGSPWKQRNNLSRSFSGTKLANQGIYTDSPGFTSIQQNSIAPPVVRYNENLYSWFYGIVSDFYIYCLMNVDCFLACHKTVYWKSSIIYLHIWCFIFVGIIRSIHVMAATGFYYWRIFVVIQLEVLDTFIYCFRIVWIWFWIFFF